MTDFNDIGISRQLDWKRIKKLFAIGFFHLFFLLSAIWHLDGVLRTKR